MHTHRQRMVFFKEAEEQANQSLVIETRTPAAASGHGMNLLERGMLCSFSPLLCGLHRCLHLSKCIVHFTLRNLPQEKMFHISKPEEESFSKP